MAAGRAKSFHRAGSLMRSKSEGTLIDLDDSVSASNNLNGKSFIWNEKKKTHLNSGDNIDQTVLCS